MALPIEARPGAIQPANQKKGFDRFMALFRRPIKPPYPPRADVFLEGKGRSRGSNGNGGGEIVPTGEIPQNLIERWRNLPREVLYYQEGLCRDRITRYPAGEMLIIGGEEVMGTFELPWVRENVRQAWGARTSPQDVAERGFGLGLMSEEIHQRMVAAQRMQIAGGVREGTQRHVIIELNKQVYEGAKDDAPDLLSGNAKKWARMKMVEAQIDNRPIRLVFVNEPQQGRTAQEELEHAEVKEFIPDGMSRDTASRSMLELVLINGDADQEILKFPPRSLNIIFSDTHQLAPQYLGIHDMLQLARLKGLLRHNGVYVPLVWHRENITGELDTTQRRLLSRDFRRIQILNLPESTVTVPDMCGYLPEVSQTVLPIVLCRDPRFD